jgi:hypothetical protein
VDVELVGSAARLVEQRAVSPTGVCRDVVEADLRLTLTSADGAFAQSFEGPALLTPERELCASGAAARPARGRR